MIPNSKIFYIAFEKLVEKLIIESKHTRGPASVLVQNLDTFFVVYYNHAICHAYASAIQEN